MITITPQAGEALKEIKEREKMPETAALRLGVTQDGCGTSGTQFRYSMDFDAEPAKANDQVFESEGVKIVVDSESYPHIQGLQLDVQEDGMGNIGFTFKNPNAKHGCGCGHTFSEDAPPAH